MNERVGGPRGGPRDRVVATCVGILVSGLTIAWVGSLTHSASDHVVAAATTSTVAQASSNVDNSTTDSVPEPERPVTLVIGGDVAFEEAARTRLDTDPSTVFGPVADLMRPADLAVVNLETAITERGTPVDKQYTFRAPPTALDALAEAGVDVASMANNHGLDYGPVGLADSLAADESSEIDLIGIGDDADEAYAPFLTEIAGNRIGIVAATQVLDANVADAWTATATHGGLASAKDVNRLARAVREAAARSEFTVVVLHWGTEGDFCPNAAQQEIVAPLVAAGADAIVGGHAHRVQGFGMSGDTFVHFGLGNFLFRSQSPESSESGVVRLSIEGDQLLSAEWLPARIDDRNRPVPLSGATATAAMAKVADRQACTGLKPATTRPQR